MEKQHILKPSASRQHGDIENKEPIFVVEIVVNENTALGNLKIQEKTKSPNPRLQIKEENKNKKNHVSS